MCVLFLIATLPRPTLSAPATWSPAFWAVLAACLVADPAGRAGVAQLSCACRFCGARVFDRRACGVFGDAWDGRRRRARRGCADGGGGGGGCRDAVAARVRDRAIVTRGRGGRWPVPQRLRDEMWWIRGCACLAWMSVALQRFTRRSRGIWMKAIHRRRPPKCTSFWPSGRRQRRRRQRRRRRRRRGCIRLSPPGQGLATERSARKCKTHVRRYRVWSGRAGKRVGELLLWVG